MIDDATTDQDLRVPPSNHFEKLRGNLAGFHSIRVNKQWRLIFRWDGGRGEAEGVYLDDHSYRVRRTMLTTKRKPATVGEILGRGVHAADGADPGARWPRRWACSASTSTSCATTAGT